MMNVYKLFADGFSETYEGKSFKHAINHWDDMIVFEKGYAISCGPVTMVFNGEFWVNE